ncbi:periplasmic divalent manganese/zinc-binding lipoprotein [Geomonas sp. Red276]
MKHVFRMLLVGILMLTFGCSSKETPTAKSGPHKPIVVATLFPVYDFAREVAGDKAEVKLLLPPGVEPHSFEPKPDDVVRIAKADVVIYTNRFMEPWAVKLLGSQGGNTEVVDASQGVPLMKTSHAESEKEGGVHAHDHGGFDPHVWLDFANAQVMVKNIADGLAKKDPANADYYRSRALKYQGELQKLDGEYKAGLADCRTRVLLHGGHYAFGYLAKRYGLDYHSAQAVDPDAEATPRKLADLVNQMRANHLKYVFCEELLSPATAEMIAKETGAQVLMLNAAHNVSKEDFTKGTTFLALMRENLANLRKGLECK